MYTEYIDHFKNLGITGEAYNKYNISILDRRLELDLLLSFTEFKNKLIKELFGLDTGDLIEYVYNIYKFTLFNIYLFNSISNKIKDCDLKSSNTKFKSESKAIVNIFKPNIGTLGSYCPSRNEIKKSTIKLDFNTIKER